MASSTQRNIEYDILLKNTAELTGILSADLLSVSTKLVAEGLIPQSLHSNSTLGEKEKAVKASELVDAVTKKVQNHPQAFQKFLQILREGGPYYSETVSKIKGEYDTLTKPQSLIVAAISPEPPPVDRKDVKTQVDGQLQSIERFPYLQTESLHQKQKERLILRLELESKEMQTKFTTLLARTKRSSERHGVSISDLRIIFKKSRKLYEELANETDFGGVWVTAQDYMSFFNYELLFCIIDSYCDDMKPEKDEYMSEFKIYCERRLCELPKDVFSQAQHADKENNLHLKIDKTFNEITANEVKELQVKLSKLLDTTLHILNIAEGCVELVFESSQDLGKITLNKEQIAILQEMSVLKLYSENHKYYNRTQSEPPAHLDICNEYDDDHLVVFNKEEVDEHVKQDGLIIVILGKSGAGKTTLINKLIQREDIIKLSPKADTPKITLEKDDSNLAALDTPGLEPSKQKEWVKVLKKVSKFGEGKANLVLLCIPVGPSNKFTDGTPEIMKYMQGRMGKEVWKYCIVVFTFSNIIEYKDMKYEEYLQKYTTRFQEELGVLDVRDVPVVSYFQYRRNPEEGIKNTIVTIPAGMEEKDCVIPGSTQTWSADLLDLIVNKCEGLTKFDMKKYRHDIRIKKHGGVGAVRGPLVDIIAGGVMGVESEP